MARKLVVEIVGDASSLDRAFKQSTRSANKFESSMGRTTRGVAAGSGAFRSLGRSVAFASGGFLAGAGITAGIKSSVLAASDLEQQVSKTNVVFGQSAQAVEEWSKTLANSFGLSEREALTLASTFGALFAPLGIVGTEAADQSRKLVELGADLASFYNTDVQDALDAIQSGLVGQARPLRRYGILLDAARVQQEALNETGKTSATQLTNQEKVLARIALIFKDSTKAQGDFARTSDTAANQSKIFQANLENLKEELGKGVIPALTAATSALNDFFAAMKPKRGEEKWWQKSGFQALQDLAENSPAPVGGFARRHRLPFTHGNQGPDVFAELTGPASSVQAAIQAAIDRANALRRTSSKKNVRQAATDRLAFKVEQTQLTKSLNDDIAANRRLNEFLKRQIEGGHDTIALRRQQLQVQLTINDLLAQQAVQRKNAREAAKQAAIDAREAAIAARTARQFAILGLGPHGEERIPGAKALRRELDQVAELPLGKKGKATVSRIRELLRTNFKGLTDEVRSVVKQMLDDLNRQLKQSSVDVTRFQKTARGQLTLAGAHPTGGVVITGPVHFHGVQNVKQMEEALAKRRRQRANARRSTR